MNFISLFFGFLFFFTIVQLKNLFQVLVITEF